MELHKNKILNNALYNDTGQDSFWSRIILNELYEFKCPLFEKSHHSKIWTVEKKTTMILLPISLISIKVYPKRTHSSHNENQLEIFWIIIDTIPKKKILKSDSTQNRVIYRHYGFNIIKKDIYKRTALRLKTCTSILSIKPWKFSKCFTLKEGPWHERPYRMNWRQRHQSMNFGNNLKPLYVKPQNVPLSSRLKAR